MSMTLMNVELVHGSKFTDEHAKINREAVHPLVYPHLYGDELPRELKIVQRSIIMPASSIVTDIGNTNKNNARSEGGNFALPGIRSSIASFGFKLKYAPIAVYRAPNGKLYKINGKTRFIILVDEWDYKDIIVDVYEANDTYVNDDPDGKYCRGDRITEDQIAYALHIFGQSSNLNDDPKGETTVEDLFHGCVHAISRGWIEKDVNGVPEWDSIEKHLNKVCRNNKLTPGPRSDLIARVIGQYNELITGKRFWDNTQNVITFIEGGGNWNFKKVNPKSDENEKVISKGIKYMVFETSEYRRAFGAATAWAHKNPDYEVRIIYYRRYMKAYDTATNWTDTLNHVVNYWNNQLNEIKDVHFSPLCKRQMGRCYIYGAVPSLKSMHDLDKMVFLDAGGNWSQR